MSRRRRRLRGLLAGGLPFRGYTASWLAGQLGLAAGLALVASAFVYLTLATGGLHAPFWQLWFIFTSWLLLQWLLRTVDGPLPALAPAAAGVPERGDQPYRQAQRWEHRLSTTQDDPAWYAQVVRDRVTALAAERLRQRHGVPLAAEPGRARPLLGDELYEFLTGPISRTPSPAELGRLTTRIEEI